MDWTVWTAFAGACVIVLMIPGPTIMLVVSYALTHGRSSAMWTVAGVGLGDFTAMTASLLGLGAILSASAELFTLLKLVGACYLIWLGVKMWRAPVDAPITPAALENGAVDAASASGPDQPKGWKMLGHAYIVTALNPKGIVFFLAFIPQFVDRS
ncbi:MAG: LysE family translocator, partial [Rhodospirillaceae bacterium]